MSHFRENPGRAVLQHWHADVREVKSVGVYGDDEGTVVYMTTHTPQTPQRVRAILAKLFETFDQQVKSRIVLKGNVRRFTAVD